MKNLPTLLCAFSLILGCAPVEPQTRLAAATATAVTDPAPEATRLMESASRHLRNKDIEPALADASRALQLRAAVLGNAHPASEQAALLVAKIHRANAQPSKGLPFLRTVLASRRQRLGPWSPELLEVLEPLVHAQLYGSDLIDARSLSQQEVAIRQATQGAGHPEHVRSLVTLAHIHRELCEFPQAEGAAQAALGFVERRASASSLELLGPLDELSRVRIEQGRRAEARLLMERSLALMSPHDQGTASTTIDRMLALAQLMVEDGVREPALALLEKAVALETQWMSDQVRTVHRLAEYWHAVGDYKKEAELRARYQVVFYAVPARVAEPEVPAPAKTAPDKPPSCVPRGARHPGNLNNAAEVIAGMRSSFRDCYNKALAQDPNLATTIRMTGFINANGEVTRALTSAHASVPGELVVCLLTTLQKGRFGPPEGGSATIVVPVTLVQKK